MPLGLAQISAPRVVPDVSKCSESDQERVTVHPAGDYYALEGEERED